MRIYIGTYEQVLPYLKDYKWYSGVIFEDFKCTPDEGVTVYYALNNRNQISYGFDVDMVIRSNRKATLIYCNKGLTYHKIGNFYK